MFGEVSLGSCFVSSCVRLICLSVLAAVSLLPRGAWAEMPIEIAFSDFFAQPVGARGLEPTARLRAADGRLVRLFGFMVQREQAQAGQFLLTPRPVAMAEHADGEADDLPASTVAVLLPAAQRERIVAHRPGPIMLTGRLEYGPAEDASGRVTWLRLYLAADALADQPSTTLPHPH